MESRINSKVMTLLPFPLSSSNAPQIILCLSFSSWFWSTESNWTLWCWNLIKPVATFMSLAFEELANTRDTKISLSFIHWNVMFNPLKPELNPICYLLALLAHHFLHVSRIRVKSLTLRLLMSYIYGAPILDVSRSHTTTQHSR